MFKKIVVGTAFLAAALAIQPTAAQAQDRYYGGAYGYTHNDGYGSREVYARDRYLDHEAHERRERWERERAFREHERRERLRHEYREHYWDRRGY